MADPYIVPDVVQYTVHQTYSGRPVANVLCYKITDSTVLVDRATSIFDMAGVLLNEWTDSILPTQVSLLSADSVSWVDLNSADGSVGSRNTSGGHTWPMVGSGGGTPMPGNVATLVKKLTGGHRGTRTGRMYLCGLDDAYTTSPANELTPATVAIYQGKLTSFLGDTNQVSAGSGGGYDSDMVVTHVLTRHPPKPGQELGSPATGESHKVTALAVQKLLATQRRRLRG